MKKIAITSTGPDLSASVDPRFGRAAFFLIIDPENQNFEAISNSQNLSVPRGAGIQAGKIIIDKNVDIVITGNCGPKAFNVLQKAGVQVIIHAAGTIQDVIRQYQNGQLNGFATAPNVEGHWA